MIRSARSLWCASGIAAGLAAGVWSGLALLV